MSEQVTPPPFESFPTNLGLRPGRTLPNCFPPCPWPPDIETDRAAISALGLVSMLMRDGSRMTLLC